MPHPDPVDPNRPRVVVLRPEGTRPRFGILRPPLVYSRRVDPRLPLPHPTPQTTTARLQRSSRRVRELSLAAPDAVRHRTSPQRVERVRRLLGQRSLRGQVDVLVSVDPAYDRLATAAARPAGVPFVVHSADLVRLEESHRALASALGALTAALDTHDGDDVVADTSALARKVREGAEILVGGAPPALVPTALVADHARGWAARLSYLEAAALVRDCFDGLTWPAKEAGLSGLTARLEWARWWTEVDPVIDGVPAAARAAVAGADTALAADDQGLAMGRWGDAWELLYHREMHAEVLRSPLVEDPAGWLGPLLASPVLDLLTTRTRRAPRVVRTGRPKGVVRALVVTGTSGDFHEEVAHALDAVANVRVRSLGTMFHRIHRQRRITQSALEDLAAMRRVPGPDAETVAAQEARATRLRRMMSRSDVVFSDWADVSTVWLSHVCPKRVRLVVRIHSVDALDGWFPVVNWSRVDEVVVIAPAVRDLVRDLLAAQGVDDVPVTLLPGLVGVDALDPAKEPGAMHTLGLVGWARRVKDVAWAFDLLERDDSWRLVLVGKPLEEPQGSARAMSYYREVLERMADPRLRDRLDVVGWTDDVASSLRRVGVILSTSRREGNNHGLVEGAASGAVPVVRDWPLFAGRRGARSVYPEEWVVQDVDEAVARIHGCTSDPASWERARTTAREQALAMFDPDRAAALYRDTILGPAGSTG